MASAFPSSMLADKRLWRFLAELTTGEPVPIDAVDTPPWFQPGVVSEILLETYFRVLELFRLRWRHGSVFVSGEAFGPRRLFWRQGDRFFGRELTVDEARTFDELANMDASVQVEAAKIQAVAPRQVRLACISCDTDEFDGIDSIPDDWVFVTRVQSYEESLEEIAADDLTRSPCEWYTHVGTCPDCQTIEYDAAEQEQFRQAYIEQQRRRRCPSCGEEPFLG